MVVDGAVVKGVGEVAELQAFEVQVHPAVQDPDKGPVEEPVLHDPDDTHHPQVVPAVQEVQVFNALQESVAAIAQVGLFAKAVH